jgi:hypothetical protein
MFINSGGSPVNVSGTDPHHPDLYGFDVYRFPLKGYAAVNAPNTPAPTLLLSKDGMSDSHGTATTQSNRYLWVMDRHANVAEIVHVKSGRWVNTVQLNGDLSADPAPDLRTARPTGRGCSSRFADRSRSAAIRTTPPARRPAWASST